MKQRRKAWKYLQRIQKKKFQRQKVEKKNNQKAALLAAIKIVKIGRGRDEVEAEKNQEIGVVRRVEVTPMNGGGPHRGDLELLATTSKKNGRSFWSTISLFFLVKGVGFEVRLVFY